MNSKHVKIYVKDGSFGRAFTNDWVMSQWIAKTMRELDNIQRILILNNDGEIVQHVYERRR